MGGWRLQQGQTTHALAHMHDYDPSFRVRNIPPGLGLFTRDWAGTSDGVLPLPFQNALFIFLSPLTLSLSLPSVNVLQTINPSPLVLSLSQPAVDVLRGAVTLTPSALVLPLSLPAVSVAQTVHPSPLGLPVVFPSVSLVLSAQTVTPDPLTFPIALPAMSVTFGGLVTPDPLVFPVALPAVSVIRGAVTLTPSPLAFPVALPAVSVQQTLHPSPLVFPLSLPDVDVLRGVVTLTPSPLAMPVVLPSVALYNILYARPDPLVFPVGLPAVVFVPGPVIVTPDPLALRLFFPRLKRGVGEATPGRVLTTTLYQVILTGAEDATTDLLLSAQSIQGTLRSTGNDRVAVYVPNGAAVLSEILARLNGTLIVWERLIHSDGTETIGEVIRAPMTEAIRRDRGPTNDTLTLAGQLAAEIPSGTTRTLTAAQQQYLEAGNNSWRVPYNVDIRPGDTVIYGANSFVVRAIQINLGITTRELQLQETE